MKEEGPRQFRQPGRRLPQEHDRPVKLSFEIQVGHCTSPSMRRDLRPAPLVLMSTHGPRSLGDDRPSGAWLLSGYETRDEHARSAAICAVLIAKLTD